LELFKLFSKFIKLTTQSFHFSLESFNFFFKAQAPFIVALVDMDAGVRINAPLRGVAESDLKIGQKVTLAFEPVTQEITLPYFTS